MCLRRFLICIFCVLGFTIMPAHLYAVHDNGLFELDVRAGVDGDQDKKNDPIPDFVGDGNTINEGDDDWVDIYNGTSSAFATAFIEDTFANNNIDNGAEAFVALRTPEDSFYTGGGSKDTHGIQEGPWLYKVESDQVPDKNDIVNAFAAAYVDPADDHVIFYFGLDTHSVNGSSNAGFWFFRDSVSLTPLEVGENTGSFTGEHSDGDIFVAVAYSEGGRVGDIDVYKWVGDDATGSLMLQLSSQDCATATAGDDVCGVINKLMPGDTFGEDPIFDYANTLVANNPGDPTSYQYESAAFVEFGLDVTALLGGSIGCFSSFLAESRSSQSDTAQLKDFALGEFNVCGLDVDKTCEAEINEAGDAADVIFYGKTTNTGAVEMVTTLTDSVAGSIFNVVCVDANENGRCGVVWNGSEWVIDLLEAAPPNLTGIGTDTVSFDHGAGVVVAYEGSYSTSSLVDNGGAPGFDFNDTVTASGLFGSDTVGPETAPATCSAVGTAAILVTKDCDVEFDGVTATFTIDGTVENTGNVKLINVTVEDDIDKDGSIDQTFNLNDLEPGETDTFTYNFDSTTQTSHSDEVTATGENVFDASDTASWMDDATCGFAPAPAMTLVKICDPAFGSNGSGVDLIQDSGVVVVRVHNIITVENTGDTLLNVVQVSDTDISQLVQDSGPTFDCSAGSSCTGSLGVGDIAVFKQAYLPDGNNIVDALTNPGGVEFKNTASSSATTTFGDSLGPLTSEASCPLCD